MPDHEHIPSDIAELYELHDFRHAAAILACEFPGEATDIYETLRQFRFTESDVTESGGNESQIPKKFSQLLRPLGWKEARLKARMIIDEEEINADTHKIDYVKNRIAFDLEWNSKDQTFDRDLYAFRAFFDYDRISVGVLVTRSADLNPYFRSLGLMSKYGASTTWMGKLLPRLTAGRNGGCPVLVVGITTKLLQIP